jgi:hypothetical protein
MVVFASAELDLDQFVVGSTPELYQIDIISLPPVLVDLYVRIVPVSSCMTGYRLFPHPHDPDAANSLVSPGGYPSEIEGKKPALLHVSFGGFK